MKSWRIAPGERDAMDRCWREQKHDGQRHRTQRKEMYCPVGDRQVGEGIGHGHRELKTKQRLRPGQDHPGLGQHLVDPLVQFDRGVIRHQTLPTFMAIRFAHQDAEPVPKGKSERGPEGGEKRCSAAPIGFGHDEKVACQSYCKGHQCCICKADGDAENAMRGKSSFDEAVLARCSQQQSERADDTGKTEK